MQKLFTVLLAHLVITAHSQELSQVSFSGGSELSFFSLLTDREVQIRISADGRLLEWGTEERSIRSSNYYAPRLQPYPGRVEYYGPEADSVSKGKVKSIGSSVITYFQSYETADRIGKIRSVGRLFFEYYSSYDNRLLQGKVKLIGSLSLDYYSTFDDQALQGKLKSVGSTSISYYNSFDDKFIRGKVKSIGAVSYSWYTSLDRQGFGGALKSGPYRQNTGGVLYIVQ